MKIFSYTILLLLVLAFCFSCDDDQCNTDTESLLKTELFPKDVDQEFIDNLSIFSPNWIDSIHYAEEGEDNIIGFVLSPNSDTTEIVYTSSTSSLKDTLFIYYEREVTFLTPECGFITDYAIDTIIHTYNIIDSIEIVTNEITTEKDGSIKIYL